MRPSHIPGLPHPTKPKQPCPHCGKRKVGLADHIRDAHGQNGNLIPRAARTAVKLDCPECGRPMKLRESIYGLFYGCIDYPECRGSHGAHPDGTPLGIPANDRTKKLRMAAHNAFDPLWNGEGTVFDSRGEAYDWMQKAMGLNVEDAHIARFDGPTCVRLVEAIWSAFGD